MKRVKEEDSEEYYRVASPFIPAEPGPFALGSAETDCRLPIHEKGPPENRWSLL
jgi:hypothetical protein